MKSELPIRVDDRVSRIVTTLKSNDDVCIGGEIVRDFAFSLIAPVRSHHSRCWHIVSLVFSCVLFGVFHHVAQLGGISHASRELPVSQPAVSHAIHQLESALETQLFVRTSKGVQLTSEGDALFSYIQQAYRLIRTGERKVNEMKQLLHGEVRIGAGDTLCRYYLLPHLKVFHESYPDLHIHVTNRTSLETVKLLKERQIDFGVVNLPIEDDSLVVWQGKILHDCFVVGERRKLLATKPVSLSDLAKQPLILLESTSVTRQHIDSFFSSRGIVLVPEVELGSIDLLVEFAKIGLGVACVIREFINDELHSGTLWEVVTEDPLPCRHIGIIWMKNVPLPSAAQRFIDILRSSQT